MANRETMTPRERVTRTLDHEIPDRMPIDLGGNQTGIHKDAYRGLLEYLGVQDDLLIMDAVQQLARPFKSVLTGDTVSFDAANCLTFDSNVTSFEWTFHDGSIVHGSKAEMVFEKPGCYAVTLWIEDGEGRRDVDFFTVRVYSRSAPASAVPTLFVTYKPAGDVCPELPVSFRVWPQGMDVESIRIDFGYGTIVSDYRPYSAITHDFEKPGIHVITVTGTAGAMPVTQKAKIVVQE